MKTANALGLTVPLPLLATADQVIGDPMTLGNMRANGVRSLDVSCWQCGPVVRSRASAIVRATYGVHPVRNHRCRRTAELEGEVDTGPVTPAGLPTHI
jgi:hypothetical protein